MSIATDRFTLARIRCHWRPVIMVGAGLVLLSIFWFASRYPQLFSKAKHVGEALPSMAYSSQLMIVAADAPVGLRILAATVNWLDSMKIGMTFGVLFGALLHTVLRYYPSRSARTCTSIPSKGRSLACRWAYARIAPSRLRVASPEEMVASRSPWGSYSVRRISIQSWS